MAQFPLASSLISKRQRPVQSSPRPGKHTSGAERAQPTAAKEEHDSGLSPESRGLRELPKCDWVMESSSKAQHPSPAPAAQTSTYCFSHQPQTPMLGALQGPGA